MKKYIYQQALKFGSALLRVIGAREISRRAFLAAGKNLGTWLAITEVIDTAAEYSDWVEENQDSIILAASVGTLGTSFIRGRAKSASVFFGTKASVFAKLSIPRATESAKAIIKNTIIKARQGALKIKFPNGETIQMMTKNGSIWFHPGDGMIGQSLLAAGFGGAFLKMSEVEWTASANQIAAAGAALLADHAAAEIEDSFRSESPIALLTHSGRLTATVQRQFPFISEDEIAAAWSLALSDREIKVDGFWIDSFYAQNSDPDDDDELVIVINGTHFVFSSDDESILVGSDLKTRTEKPLSPEHEQIVQLIGEALDRTSDPDHSVAYSEVQNKYFSEPVGAGEYAVCVVWDEESSSLMFYVEKDGFLSNAADNILDEIEDSVAELAAFKAAQVAKLATDKIEEVTGLSFGDDEIPEVRVGAKVIKDELRKMGKPRVTEM